MASGEVYNGPAKLVKLRGGQDRLGEGLAEVVEQVGVANQRRQQLLLLALDANRGEPRRLAAADQRRPLAAPVGSTRRPAPPATLPVIAESAVQPAVELAAVEALDLAVGDRRDAGGQPLAQPGPALRRVGLPADSLEIPQLGDQRPGLVEHGADGRGALALHQA